ncbi:MAG: VOC family protein [Acidimicrobiia bacterium]|nr:VOC family protein [Acidimicrobiia bacterium]
MSSHDRPGGFHHVAYACRDIDATHHFYQDLMGMPLIHTEIKEHQGGFLRHIFYDTGDGSCLAFFDLHGVGEREGWSSAVSTGNQLPVWVNHVAFSSDAARQEDVKARMAAEGIEPYMEVDHGWCISCYYVDPNGILVELCRVTSGFAAEPERAAGLLHSTEPTDVTVPVR